MVNIDFLTLKAFLSENIDFLIGSRLQKIQQPTRRDFILYLRNSGASKKLYININPSFYHIAFMSKENEEKRSIRIPQKPPMFCMLLRKYIESAKIIDAVVIENERILELHFESYDELTEKHILCLTIELMGKYSNLILYDKDTSIIIGCAHNVGPEKSKYRELQGGFKYIYPPQTEFKLSNELQKQFQQLDERKIKEYLNKTEFKPAIKDDRYTLFSELLEDSVRQTSVSAMLDNYYADFQGKINLKNEKKILIDLTNKKIKRTQNAMTKISDLLKQRNNTDKYKLYGELLTANVYKSFNYAKSIDLFDYINNQNVTIELDETKTLSENAQKYYKLYTKSKNTRKKSEEMLNNLNIELKYLENILYSIERAENIDELDDIRIELGISNNKNKKQEKILVEKIKISNFDVYIGKNNKQNDYIVSKLAKDEDYWFHTKLCAGSHVLLKINGIEPDEKLIFECCKLARKYSSATQPSKVGVIYTKAKNLRKPPASPLGYVTYKNEKEILV